MSEEGCDSVPSNSTPLFLLVVNTLSNDFLRKIVSIEALPKAFHSASLLSEQIPSRPPTRLGSLSFLGLNSLLTAENPIIFKI
jgi:hypothetical protein